MIRFFIQIFIIFIVYNMMKIFPLFVYKTMVDALLFMFQISVLWSVIKNAHAIKWISDSNFNALEGIFNANKLIQKVLNLGNGNGKKDEGKDTKKR